MPAGKSVVSFPHMGNYYIQMTRFFKTVFPDAEVLPPPPTTKKTLELGSRHSPDYVCSPFKYNMGNFIEALERGANILLQTGIGCRYGYYGEVQERILRDLGYDFKFLCLSRENAAPGRTYGILRDAGSSCGLPEFIRAGIFAYFSVRLMDGLEYHMRENIGFESVPGSFEALHEEFLNELARASSFAELIRLRRRYGRAYRSIGLNKPEKLLRVGIVGELYTLMEPFSNFYLERELAKYGVAVSRKMSAAFLASPHTGRAMRGSKGYLKYAIGANGADSVYQTRLYAKKGYDGVIHMKSFGCTPELNAMPALQNIAADMNIPVLHLSFDSQTGETGIQTRLEAFADMLLLGGGANRTGRGKKHGKSTSGSGYRLDFDKGSGYRRVE